MAKAPKKTESVADRVRSLVTEQLKDRMEENDDPIFVTFNSQIQIPRRHTGSLALDELFGGGIPEGRIIQIFGPESGGKTSITLSIAGQMIKDGVFPIGFIDAENAIDPAMAKNTFGVDLFDEEKVIFSQQDDAEVIYEMLGAMADAGVPLAIVDSTDAMLTEAEEEGGFADAHVGQLARRHSLGLKKLKRKLRKSGMILILISQVRQKIEMGGGPKARGPNETTSGGNAIRFYASIRARVSRIEYIPANGDPKGMKMSIKTHKNKTARPFRKVELTYMYDRGIVSEADSLRVGVKYGVILQRGSIYEVNGEKFKGAQEITAYFENNPSVWATIRAQILKAMQSDANQAVAGGATNVELDDEGVKVESPAEDAELEETPAPPRKVRQPKGEPETKSPSTTAKEDPSDITNESSVEGPLVEKPAEEAKELSAYMRRKLKKQAEEANKQSGKKTKGKKATK